MRKNAYMSTEKQPVKKRPRKVSFSRHDVEVAANFAERVSAQYQGLAELLTNGQFVGVLTVDGGQQLTDSLVSLHELCGRLEGLYYASLVPVIGTPVEDVPESVPESGSNTRRNVGDSRVSPDASAGKKSKKTP
jgi:hypothetical protein